MLTEQSMKTSTSSLPEWQYTQSVARSYTASPSSFEVLLEDPSLSSLNAMLHPDQVHLPALLLRLIKLILR